MKRHNKLSLVLTLACIALLAAAALLAAGCTNTTAPEATNAAAAGSADATVIDNYDGDDEVVFTFVVVDLEENSTNYEIHTGEETVGAALLDAELIEGEDSEYGLYVTSVNGIAADWDNDQTYWAFYIDGEYAMTGVDATDATDGATYSFVLTKSE